MQYITIVADSYEEAAEKARKEYGDAIRIPVSYTHLTLPTTHTV